MVVDLGLTPKEKQIVFERLGRIAKGNIEWDAFLGAETEVTKVWDKFMTAIFGADWKKNIQDQVL